MYDEFAGWGGSSQGATAVPEVELVLAANHSPKAVEVHALNFPDADHYLGDVTKADLTRFPRADLFWSSPACPPFSNARGEKQFFDAATQAVLFDDPDESEAERAARVALAKRRALMEEVPRYLRAVAGRGEPVLAGVVENVPPVRKWDRWDAWRREIETAGPGYRTKLIALNSMHAHAVRTRWAPQSRPRAYLAYWLATLGRDPDWDKWLRPRAYCPTCDQVVAAVQVWKQPGQDMGVYGPRTGQYVYRCPRIHGAWKRRQRPGLVEPDALPAAVAIDWTLPPGQRIGERTTTKGRPDPLEPATLTRIGAALAKFAGRAVLTPAGGTRRTDGYPVDIPMPTRTTKETDALVTPPALLVPTTARARSAYPAAGPMRTQTTRQETALVLAPFLTTLRGGGSKETGRGIDQPLATFSAQGTHHALIGPPATVASHGTGDLLVPYYGKATARPVTAPAGTFPTRDRWALLGVPTTTPNPGSGPDDGDGEGWRDVSVPAVEECTFRMLTPREIAAGMAFDPAYKVTGSQRDQVAGLGNAVTPPAAEIIVSALVEAITGQPLPDPAPALAVAA
jgi:DNA (cytosine-5)-methyltransferase 1